MRYNATHNQNRLITFSHWSRKSYALFAVIGKRVRIGVLKIDLAKVEITTIKQHLQCLLNLDKDESLDEEFDLATNLLEMLAWESYALLNQSKEYCIKNYYKII
ncbi:hypothetical protein K4L44_14290 [Halosquirtibacter laminarini]|uniref:Uncharacterized protein n=1 Tax=Halosquirtibacter laminarini TaxID=3374600 RepID=A0AC61NDT2_9BACT|nr:hypothetical protein K4L44_14290 [Prolixibacteraceae bacterium]